MIAADGNILQCRLGGMNRDRNESFVFCNFACDRRRLRFGLSQHVEA